MGIEDGNFGFEYSQEKPRSFLEDMGVTPEKIEEVKRHRSYQQSSTEYIIYEALVSRLFEAGQEWDETKRNRVRNLVGALKVVGFPNMTEREHELFRLSSERGFFDNSQYEINDDTIADIKNVWSKFNLKKPTKQDIHPQLSDTIQALFPQQEIS